jgi:hypothetical protein
LLGLLPVFGNVAESVAVLFQNRRNRLSVERPESKSGILFHELVQPQASATTLRILVEDPSTSEVGSLIIPLSQVN